MSRERIKILGVPFDKISEHETIDLIVEHLHQAHAHKLFIATPNPEMLLEAQKNASFKKILQETNLNIPDGIGIIFAAKFLGKSLKGRVTGTDILKKLCEKLNRETKIFLLGAHEGVAEKTATKLQQKNSHLQIAGTYAGSPEPENDARLRDMINRSGAKVLFVAYGAPKQEQWLARNLPHLSHVKVAMGVGGAFNFIAGVRRRAPLLMQKLGLEWLFRLIQEPRRIKRIFNATIKFPIVFLLDRINHSRNE